MSDENQSAAASPDALGKAVASKSTGDRGVRRLNRVPLFILGGGALLVMLVILWTVYQKSQHPNVKGMNAHDGVGALSLPQDFHMQTSGEIPAGGRAKTADTGSSNVAPASAQPTDDHSSAASTPENKELQRAWQLYYQQEAQIAARKQQTALSALSANPNVSIAGPGRTRQASFETGSASGMTPSEAARDAINTALGQNGQTDPNLQAQKRAFLNGKNGTPDYLEHSREAERTPYDIKAGTVIPAIMVSGLNSDLPGQIIARVRENVYDTKTGTHLIIPQNATLIGTYDNSVTMGQERALTAWRRIIMPDASSIDLDLMPGSDRSGFAGFEDQVNSHYLKIFGAAALMSVFSAGIQLSQPQATNGQNYSATQTIAGAIGQQMGELGEEIARRNMQIQPTIEIRQGYLFNVMVTKDIVMPPWVDSNN